ncbi:hypothetical protein [Lentilactobacillus sp. SPB1-3]|uniref:Uncharacterized protein n=1 Tax=Lentilactobacillus terminaliae TaxID=3003483 RepID=A0ACD5DCZ8_9LACO|nr:hypothetical protein [Lentilactobacillus sp. SPB1-3]MCZ0978003.1 hypothetical protein [Lentilactobacillus sp. SPB1-3]
MITDFNQRMTVINRRIERAKQDGDDKMLGGLLTLRNRELINHREERNNHVRNFKRITL